MKTMQKTIALTVTVLFSTVVFSQVNLGLKTTTQAATNAAVSANAVNVKPVVNTATQSTKAAVSTTTNTGAAVKTKAVTTADAKATKAVKTTNDVKSDVKRSEERRVGKECRYRWSPYH